MPSVSAHSKHSLPAASHSTSGCAAPASPPTPAERPGKTYWRSLDDLADTPEFREFVFREFPASATQMLETDAADRRQFLKIMAASMALGGVGSLAGCRRWPDSSFAPYAHRPPHRTPGIPVHYATSMEVAGVGAGLLVTSYDGRPIKIEGNPQHPVNQGGTTAIMQASVLDLYDQDRSRGVLLKGHPSTWDDFVKWAGPHFAAFKSTGGAGIAFLCEDTSSPSVHWLRTRIAKDIFPKSSWRQYEPINNDNQLRGWQLAFGAGAGDDADDEHGVAYRPMYDFAAAKTIVALDADFLGMTAPAAVKWTRDFAAARQCDDGSSNPSRLYAFEAIVSLTGANADHRVALRSSDVAVIAAWLAWALGLPGIPASLARAEVQTVHGQAHLDRVKEHLLADLQNGGSSLVVAGPRQPPEVHMLAHLINQRLGNVGKTVNYARADGVWPHAASLKALVEAINARSVQTLVILGGNPVYTAPADLNFAAALAKVENIIHVSDYVDETSGLMSGSGDSARSVVTWHINRAHFLESWTDTRAYDGTYGIGQPLIAASDLFNGKTLAQVLAVIAGDGSVSGLEITRAAAASVLTGNDAEQRWQKALVDGFIADSAAPLAQPPAGAAPDIAQALAGLDQRRNASKGEMEVVFAADQALYDGRYANNGWLQELPDPIAKLTWDNAVFISAGAAERLHVKTGEMLKVACNGKEATAPCMVIPGMDHHTAHLPLGYGRTLEWHVAKDAGFNFYPLRTTTAMDFCGASISKASGSYVLATTQDHHAIDSFPAGVGTQKRLPTLFREASLDTFRNDPHFVADRVHVPTRLSLFPEDHAYQTQDGWTRNEYAWGLSIDLNACTGCNACVIACQAENNIPVVGKDQVKRGREMHWIRIDRYFKGSHERSPDGFVLAPVTCMQCENAPCEQVCPVAATTHDEQGLNVMVYNRCIGTRYCSNNCPYKVRRFNYFDYWRRGPLREQPGILLQVEPGYYQEGQAKADPLRQLQMNPEVTVRMRGIMEKCTYCVQRISEARIAAKNEWVRRKNLDPADPRVQDARVPIADGTITPACAQACPARAITFGDLKDKSSRVSAQHKNPRAYEMLEELNTKPRTRYLARIRNPAFEDAAAARGASHGSEGSGH
jgi:molybdopterin-containing oxidoreductase family iron-sulfur binding subunit